jgi:hypothetical protein
MPGTDEKVPFNMATGQMMTEEEFKQHKEANTKPPEENATETPAAVVDPPAEQQATEKEAAAAGTTPDAVEAFFSSEMAEKYGIKSKDELFGILETINDLKAERDQLKGRTTEPLFANDKQKNIYNFLQEYENMGEGMEMVARLGNIDPMNMDANAALKEAFILENKDLTREQAGRMFDKKELKKYENPKAKEDYEDPQDFEDENEMLKIQKERDTNRARKLLLESKEKFKAQAQEKKKEAPDKEESPIPPHVLAKYTGEADKFFSNFNTLKFSEDDGSNEMSVKFTPEQLRELKEATKAHINNPIVYNEKGEIKDFDIVNLVNTFAFALYNRQMTDVMLKQVKTLAQATKAEQIAQKQPDKVSGGADTGLPDNKSFWGQAEAAAKKKAAERQANPGRRSPLPAG